MEALRKMVQDIIRGFNKLAESVMDRLLNPKSVLGLLLVAVISLGLMSWAITGLLGDSPEIQISLTIILGVGLLMLFLFVLAIGFARMNLADSSQALGLPGGSIRAMIALSLIVIFVIVGIYLFRAVSVGPTSTSSGLTIADLEKLPPAIAENIIEIDRSPVDGSYQIRTSRDVGEDATRIAEGLTSTIGTLVVAVAGFYFGTRSVAVAKGETIKPIISVSDPKQNDLQDVSEPFVITVTSDPPGYAIKAKFIEGTGEIELIEHNKFKYTPTVSGKVKLSFLLAAFPELPSAEISFTNKVDPGPKK
ncbi:MAG: hypothetical protein DWQ07_12680 [Chloroflexi bacterium]|nr:MAG: hypothetical protein DWQ07_12680 [Chloroflexota bacterium]MBL1196893.1 hypothetical protein [Chloroflexota bacterium]NOH14189.1 hypothetical protein [Chloroflexota bacterium]